MIVVIGNYVGGNNLWVFFWYLSGYNELGNSNHLVCVGQLIHLADENYKLLQTCPTPVSVIHLQYDV